MMPFLISADLLNQTTQLNFDLRTSSLREFLSKDQIS